MNPTHDNPTTATVDAVAFLRDALGTLPADPVQANVDDLRATVLALDAGLKHRVAQLLAEMREIGVHMLQREDVEANGEDLHELEWLRVLVYRCGLAHQNLIVYADRAAEAHGITLGALVGGD